jgi:hypothetical protein
LYHLSVSWTRRTNYLKAVSRGFPPFSALGTALVTLSATAPSGGATRFRRSREMFDYRKISENAAAAVLAIVLSAVSVGATVAPVQSTGSGPSLSASAPTA